MTTPASDDGILITLPKGLLGFPHLTTYRLFEPSDGYPLKFLQAVDQPEISFVCMDPVGLKPDYTVPLSDTEAEELALEAPADALILTLVVIPEDPRRMTTNLAGPLVVNARTRLGMQVALPSDRFPLKFPVFPQA
ncbi:MAG TPA: flagellar assembly protein FliW [Holophagaceae bacterium]